MMRNLSGPKNGFGQYWSRFASLWRQGHGEAWKDMRRNWHVLLIIIIWFGGIIACVVMLSLFVTGDTGAVCQPDGSFSVLNDEPFSYWSSSGFFQITLGFGELTFTQAKVIDLVWDIIFGRGGQSLVAFISWRVLSQYFTIFMEKKPITLDTYRTIFLQNDTSIVAIARMIRDFAFRFRLQSIATMCFVVVTLIYILIFPTLGSAMTGYSANVGPYIPDRNGSFIPFSEWRRTAYIIHDGRRINLTDEYHVSHLPEDEGECSNMWFSHNLCPDLLYPAQRSSADVEWAYTCQLLHNITAYTKTYGFGGRFQEMTVFANTVPIVPALNITPVYLGTTSSLWLADNATIDGLAPFDKSKELWTLSNQTYDQNYVRDNGRCQAEKTYQWGFSYILLNILVISAFVWSAGMLILYLRSRKAITKSGSARNIAGRHKAVLELASAMHDQLLFRGNEDKTSAASTTTRFQSYSSVSGGDDATTPRKSAFETVDLSNKTRTKAVEMKNLATFTSSSSSSGAASYMMDNSALSEKTINRYIEKDLRGGCITYRKPHKSATATGHQTHPIIESPSTPFTPFTPFEYNNYNSPTTTTPFISTPPSAVPKSRIKAYLAREKIWLPFLIGSLLLSAIIVFSAVTHRTRDAFAIFFVGLGIGFAAPFAFFIGSTGPSRVVLCGYAFLLVCVVPDIVIGSMGAARGY